MDTDTNDTSAGVNDTLNGETKPDPAKLAQQAIIKQDVMLSGTSTQSPVSSILTMPSVSMSGGMPTMGAPSLMSSDSIFLSSVPSLTNDADKHDIAGTRSSVAMATREASPIRPVLLVTGAVSQSATSVASPAPALLGQPQVAAPQYIVTTGGMGQGGVGLQQLLIPVSTAQVPQMMPSAGNGTQQLLSIPVSLAAGAGNQIQLLTTANGQIIATNLSNLAGLSNLAAPIVQAVQGNGVGGGASCNTTTTQSMTNNSMHATVAAVNQQSAANQAAALPQLITNAQGQIVAIGTPSVKMLAQTVTVAPSISSNSMNHVALAQTQTPTATTAASTLTTAQQLANQLVNATSKAVNHSTSVTTQGASALSMTSANLSTVQQVQQVVTVAPSTATTITSTPNINQLLPSGTTSLPPNINQLLPNTVSNSSETTTVDGINLDEIKEFAKQFKIRRLSLGLTQTQVGQALSATEGPSYSQSAICRFEKLDITPKSAQKIKPVLERWMAEAEERYKNGVQNLTDFIGSEPSKKRKRRTSFTPQALEVLNEHFERNTHPSGAEMTELSDKLNYDREVIRVWFCNKRQALKNTIKKLKSSGESFS